MQLPAASTHIKWKFCSTPNQIIYDYNIIDCGVLQAFSSRIPHKDWDSEARFFYAMS